MKINFYYKKLYLPLQLLQFVKTFLPYTSFYKIHYLLPSFPRIFFASSIFKLDTRLFLLMDSILSGIIFLVCQTVSYFFSRLQNGIAHCKYRVHQLEASSLWTGYRKRLFVLILRIPCYSENYNVHFLTFFYYKK